MRSERQNEWADRLDQLEAVPGEDTFSRQSAWDKLYNRLDAKPKRKVVAWYWIAASVAIIVLPAIAIVTTQRVSIPDSRVTSLPYQKEAASSSTRLIHPPVVTTEPGVRLQKSAMVRQSSKQTSSKIKAKAGLPIRFSPVSATVSVLPQSVTGIERSNPDSLHTLAVVAPAKKQLPVVHANELMIHEKEMSRFASSPKQSAFDKLFNRTPGTGQSNAQLSGSENINPIILLKN